MELGDKVAVVTGAASGIGRAMARRFADAGARGVVVSDVDAVGAKAVAAEIEARRAGVAVAIACDVSVAAEIANLIALTEEAFGPIDLFCANAGIGGGEELGASDELWELAFDVNVRSHIHAARILVPDWVERGGGYFLSTASAAGLLTMIGSAAYTVTKHAAVAFAEWLSITYGDQGVRVSCLCPMGVRTKMLEEGMDLPGNAGVGLRITAGSGPVLEPEQVADAVVEGLADERFLILPHPELQDLVQRKVADRDAWIAGMRRLQAKIAETVTQ